MDETEKSSPFTKTTEIESSKHFELNSDFRDNISDFQVLHFVNNFQRKSDFECEFIMLNDVKDVVLFTYSGNLNSLFLELFYTPAFDQFLRSLIVYFQYFARLWFIIAERCKLKKKHIAHPMTEVHEKVWREQLSDLRFLVARDYTTILLGMNNTVRFHHFFSRTQTPEGDRTLYENIKKFSLRTVEVVLSERGNSVIHEEFDRLFSTGTIKGYKKKKNGEIDVDLENDFYCPKLQFKSPLIKELYRPNRNPLLKEIGIKPLASHPNESTMGIELAFLCSEKFYSEANISLGVLGLLRKQYDPLLRNPDLTIEGERFSLYDVKIATVFGEIIVDRLQAYAIVHKRDINQPYNIDEEFYEILCFNMKKERHRLKELWHENEDEKCRWNYEGDVDIAHGAGEIQRQKIQPNAETEEVIKASLFKNAEDGKIISAGVSPSESLNDLRTPTSSAEKEISPEKEISQLLQI